MIKSGTGKNEFPVRPAELTAALAGAPFGVKGWIKITSLSGETAHLLNLKKVTLRRDGISREYLVEEVSASPLALKFAGIGSPEAAKALKGAEIIVPREAAAPLGKDEFYIEDLRGLAVVCGPDRQRVGNITGVVEGGGGFLAEITLESGETRLVPFRNEFFGAVDLDQVELLAPWILE